jgi:hypothetical protein
MNERLQSVSEYIGVCYAMAAACRELVNQEVNEQLREDLLTIEQRWLFLADSFQCMERIGRLLVGAPQDGTASRPLRPSTTVIGSA